MGLWAEEQMKLLWEGKRTEKPGPETAVSKPVYLTISEGGFSLIYLHRMFL